MRTIAALSIVALAGTLAGCNHNDTHTMNDHDRYDRDTTRTTYRSDATYHTDYRTDGVVDFAGYDDRGGAINSAPVTVTTRDLTDSGRGYDDRELPRSTDRVVIYDDRNNVGASTYDDRDSAGSGTTARTRDNTWGYTTVAANPDTRILSILHCKNQEEIKLGRLAQQNGSAQDVKDYGEMLVRDHSASDAKVLETARNEGITLMSEDQVKQMVAREKGESQPRKDCYAELQNKHGAEFDAAFSRKMEEGHEEAIAMIKDAQSKVQNSQVRMLLADTLPKLEQHEDHAQALAGVHEHDDDR